MDPKAISEHRRIAEIQGQIYLKGTEREGVGGLAETNLAPSRIS
jgi:hypothetical protein